MTSSDDAEKSIARFEAFQSLHTDVEYIWAEYVDYAAVRRTVMIPVDAFREQLRKGKGETMFGALRYHLPNDTIALGGAPTGEILLAPDLDTLVPNKALSSPSATVLTWWTQDHDNDGKVTPAPGCPRRALQDCCDVLAQEYQVSARMGFEIEVCFVRPVIDEETGTIKDFRPLPALHHAYHLSHQQLDTLPMIEDIVRNLREIGINVPGFHAEAAPGQWEFPLPPREPLQAVDNYYQARAVIANVAREYGLKSTFYPRPYDNTCGSASHMHFSIKDDSDQGRTLAHSGDKFIAGVLEHFAGHFGILAFAGGKLRSGWGQHIRRRRVHRVGNTES